MNNQQKLEQLKKQVVKLEEEIKNEIIIQEIPAKILKWGKTADKKMNFKDAQKWCEKQGEGWRLPTIVELQQACHNNVAGFYDASYWSATEYNTFYAWRQSFADGTQSGNGKNVEYYVRCVFGR